MPRKGENIRKRKDGLWEGRYPSGTSSDGKTKYASIYAKSYTQAKEKLLIAKMRIKQAEPRENRLYEDVLLEWLEIQAVTMKISTYVKFRNLINGHISPAVGKVPLQQMSSAQLASFLQEKAQRGRLDGRGGLSNSTLQALFLILKSSLEYAAREQYMSPITFTLKCPETERKPARALTAKEQAALEYFLCSELDVSRLGILLCLYTGLRIGEVCALHWRDIDLANGLIYIRQTVQRLQNRTPSPGNKTTLLCGLPKSKCSLRSIPIPPCLMESLRMFHGAPDSCVLTGLPDRLMDPRTYQYRFKRYLAHAGVPNANFHVLRHTFGTRFVELGGDPKTLSELLGHASVEITLNKYVHPSLDIKRQQMERFSVIRGMNSGNVD